MCVKERILKNRYKSLADMEDDFFLLCRNARTYNQEGSQIYSDSIELETGFLAARAEIEAELEEQYGDSDNEDPSPTPEVWCACMYMGMSMHACTCTYHSVRTTRTYMYSASVLCSFGHLKDCTILFVCLFVCLFVL